MQPPTHPPKPRGVRTDDAEIVAMSDIIKLMDKQKHKIDEIIGHLPQPARDRVLMWMDQKYGKAAQIGEFAEQE